MKLLYLCKFKLKVYSGKLYEQVPTKIMRQLQERARKMKYSEKIY